MNETEDYPRPSTKEPSAGDDRLMEAVRAYQAALDRGDPPGRKEFLARYPDLASELAECLDGLEFLHSAAPGLRPPPEAPPPLEPEGPLGDFRIVREVGRGGMGVVYEAVQISLGRRVALKVLPLAATLDARQLQRFENEARAAAHLHHPNIVPVFAVGCERGVHYYAMQFIEGRTLAAVIDHLRQAPKPAPPAAETAAGVASVTHQSVVSRAFFRTAATLAAQAAEALEYAHQMGVVHRDVKPANLLLDARGNLWITDFGLARFQASPGVTSPGDLVGTLRYMSPEQAAGQPVIDPRSDVYSLGATLYELLTQQPAFGAAGRQECLRQILEDEPTPPRRLNRAVPAELETIVLKAMAKSPADRYPSAKELADDLRRFLDDQPVRARRPGLRERAAKWAWRHRRVVAGAVLSLAAAVLVLAATTWRVARAEALAVAAKSAVEEEKERTAAALEQAVAQRDRAERNFAQARKVLDSLTRVGVDELAHNPEAQGLRRRLLTELVDYYQEFIDQHGDDPSVADDLRETQMRVAKLLDEMGKKKESLVVYRKMFCGDRLPGGRPPLVHFGGPFGPPPHLARLFLLGRPGVQQELKLTSDQVQKLEPVVDFRQPMCPGDSPAEAEKMLRVVLQHDQSDRLKQIVYQSRGPHALLDPEAANALGLTEDQKKEIHHRLEQSMRAGWRRGPGPGPRGFGGPRRGGPGRGEPPPRVDRKQVNEQVKQVNEQVLRVLTPEQQKQWQAMLGKPFKGELHFVPPHPPPPPDEGPEG
jgi:eukaryotic-like serine/threonine-protein kinase